jgi:hypothetical protein
MAPARLPATRAAPLASRPTTARSKTASAWSGGREAIRPRASSVVMASMARSAVSSRPATKARSSTGTGTAGGWRLARRRWSIARFLAMVVIQPRKSPWLPRNLPRSRVACSQVSEAMSSASLPTR